jgi:hypothetical protein
MRSRRVSGMHCLELLPIEAGNAKVPTQVQQVYRADVAAHCDQRHASGTLHQDYRAAHICAVHRQPQVGGSVVFQLVQTIARVWEGRASARRQHACVRDQVCPPAPAVSLPHAIDGICVEHSVWAKTQNAHADAIDPVDRLPGLLVAAGEQRGGQPQRIAIQGEARPSRSSGIKFRKCRRRPVPVGRGQPGMFRHRGALLMIWGCS